MLIQKAAAEHGVRPAEYLEWPRHEREFIEQSIAEWLEIEPTGFN